LTLQSGKVSEKFLNGTSAYININVNVNVVYAHKQKFSEEGVGLCEDGPSTHLWTVHD